MKEALILVDLQNDFVPGGALAVPEGDQIVPAANRLADRFGLVVATQDWHPREHGSFAANHDGKKPGEVIDLNGLAQILWPVHCVQGTPGAEFLKGLKTDKITKVFQKGADPAVDSYSGFYDNGRRHSTGLGEYLKAQGVKRVCVCGLATDYCVKFTVLDALRDGFEVVLAEDACRGVNLQPDDSKKAIEEMKKAGAKVEKADKILSAAK
jgi:nicotinamidase/pyrazinamidase